MADAGAKVGQKASDLFIQCLEERAASIASSSRRGEPRFLDSLSRSKKIRLIVTRHEQGAGFMAATYGRTRNRKTGVCIAH